MRHLGVIVAFVLVLLASSAFGQYAFLLDVDGDGVPEYVAPASDSETVTIQWLFGDQQTITLSGSAPNESFGWRVMELPDINGDGLPDLLVSAPGMQTNSHYVGGFYAFSGATGQLLWRTPGIAVARTGMGAIVIPDQSKDGIPDVLAIMISGCEPIYQFGLVLSGATGEMLAVRDGKFSWLAERAKTGTILFTPTDVNDSGVVDTSDLDDLMQWVASGDTRADLNKDGTIDATDLLMVLDDVGTTTIVTLEPPPDSIVTDGSGLEVCTEYTDDELDPWDLCTDLYPIDPPVFGQDGSNITMMFSCGVTVVVDSNCTDPRVAQALADPRIQGIIQAAQLQCCMLGNPNATEIWIHCWNCEDDHWTKTRLPPSVNLCMGMFIPGQLGYDDILETLMHELTHVRQLCQNPDDFHTGTNNAICAEMEGYCAMPRNYTKCQTAQGRCDLACLSAMHEYCFGDRYARCKRRCMRIEADCHRGYYTGD